jgi:hypothetical protein
MERKRRPGFVTQYALHAGISKQAAAEQLRRVGINYLESFDFADADRLRAAMRHADRAPFAKPIYMDPAAPMLMDDADSPAIKDPAFAEIQKRREHFRAELARLDFEERIQTLTPTDKVKAEAFRVGRLVRDAVLNVPSRLAGILAAETDQRKVHDLLEQELRQALEVLAITDNTDDPGGTEAA